MGIGMVNSLRIGKLHRAEHFHRFSLPVLPAHGRAVYPQAFLHLPADPVYGIEGGHRFLENNADVIPLIAAQLISRTGQKIGAAKHYLSCLFHIVPAEKPGDCQRCHGFSGAGFPYQPHDIPFFHMQVKMMHHGFGDQVIMKFQIQIDYVKHRLPPFQREHAASPNPFLSLPQAG